MTSQKGNRKMSNVCPRTGRSPMRRKKNYVFLLLGACCLYGFIQLTNYNEGYTPLRPLSDAQSEANRLLKFITNYNYQCNVTLQLNNRTHWPICTDRDVGIDVDSRDDKLVYTIGAPPNWDFSMEKLLALNHSFQVYIISHQSVPTGIQHMNNTHVIKTVITPNDYADFSRNSYGQQTLNDLMNTLGHKHVNILRIAETAGSVQTWELLHFMINDNLLMNVHQLQLAINIDKLDEDVLYSWYRNLYEMFYKEGFRLYHTTSNDLLCLQVTMMQSCIYYLSLVRIPQHRIFVLHPPADFGTSDSEEQRLVAHLSQIQGECSQYVQEIGGMDRSNEVQYTTPGLPHWHVCSNQPTQLFKKPCSVVRFRSGNDQSLEGKLLSEGCSIITLVPVLYNNQPIYTYKMHSHQPNKKTTNHFTNSKSSDEVLQILSKQGVISLLEVDVPGHEWDILTTILDSGLLENVTQVVAEVQIPDKSYGRHPKALRRRYSELRRLESQGFKLFHASPSYTWQLDKQQRSRLKEGCCYKVGYIQKSSSSLSRS